MGAGFVLIGLPSFDATDTRIKEIERVVKGLHDDYLDDLFAADPGVGRGMCKCAVDWLRQYGLTGSREIAVIPATGMGGLNHAWAFTGGMCYGSPPTDAFDHFGTFNEVYPVYKLMVRWAVEDEQARHSPIEPADNDEPDPDIFST